MSIHLFSPALHFCSDERPWELRCCDSPVCLFCALSLVVCSLMFIIHLFLNALSWPLMFQTEPAAPCNAFCRLQLELHMLVCLRYFVSFISADFPFLCILPFSCTLLDFLPSLQCQTVVHPLYVVICISHVWQFFLALSKANFWAIQSSVFECLVYLVSSHGSC